MTIRTIALVSWAFSAGCAGPPPGIDVHVAVAANFANVQVELARRFAEKTGDSVRASAGATGQLYAQIRNGAPFDVLLSADAERPRRLEEEGLAVAGSRFTYAIGRLALYAPRRAASKPPGPELLADPVAHIAIANPETAPYGAAAVQVMRSLQLLEKLRGTLVTGESIAQTLQFVKSGAAEMGFVSYSQIIHEPPNTFWLVLSTYHQAIVQEAVLLQHGARNPVARAYLDFLRSPEAQTLIRSFGYDVPAAR